MTHAMMVPSLSREQRTDGRRVRRSVICLKAATLLWLAASCSPAFAFLSCSTNNGALDFTLPSGNYAIPRDMPTGARITPFSNHQTTYQNFWTCSKPDLNYAGPWYKSLLSSSGQTFWENGNAYQVFNTNLPGVGLIMQVNSYGPGRSFGPYSITDSGWWIAGAYPGPFFGVSFGTSIAFAFVKTGPITPGTVSLGAVAQAAMADQGIVATTRLPVTVTGSPVFTAAACTTPNIPVDLGTHRTSEFSGPNSVTSSVNFDLALNNCPAGMNAIQYQVDAVTPIISATNSVVALDASSTASGVGLQLLNGSGTPFPLGSAQTFSGYSSATGGSYTIPFKARYLQTGSTVGPGRANSVMTFTMTYQ